MCFGGCNTSSTTTAANPDAQAAYDDVVSKAQGVASTPYQPYTGELVAGLNSGQNTAINQLSGSYGAAQPYINRGSSDLSQAGAGLGAVQGYLQAGSDATAGVQPNIGAAQNQFGQGNTLTLMGSSANQGVGTYQGLASGAYGQAQGYAGLASGAYGLAQGYGGLSAGAYGQEMAGLGSVGNYLNKADGYFGQAASLATPQDFASNVGTYENPFTQDVINSTMAQLNQNDAVQASTLSSSDIGSGAYGGDRNSIAQAALAGQQDLANNSTVAGLNEANFQQATNEFNAVQGQRQQGASILSGLGSGELQAGGEQLSTALGYGQAGAGYAGLGSLENQTDAGYSGLGSLADQTGAGYSGLGQLQGQVAQEYGTLANTSNAVGSGYLSAGQLGLGTAAEYGNLGTLQGTTGQAYGTLGSLYGNLGSTAQGDLISSASAGLQGATLEQQNQQQQDTAAYNQYMAGLSYPYQNVGFLSNIVQGIGSQEGNTQTTQGNALSSIAGLGVSSIGILGATGAFGANGYLSGLAATSDVRAKENIAPIGETYDGQTLYRYNYKGSDPRDVKTGLMAQEVAQRDPNAVGVMPHGLLGVDYDRATRDAASMGLGARSPFRGAEAEGMNLASRLARATGGPVPGLSPVGGPTMPTGLGAPSPVLATADLGSRPRFDDGGAAIPTAGLNTSPNGLLGGGALNTSPMALMNGSTATAHAPQPGGMRSALMTAPPTSPQFAGAGQGSGAANSGLGAVAAFPGGSATGLGGAGLGTPAPTASTQDPSSSGFSPGAASGDDSTKQASLGTPAPGNTGSGGGLGGISQNGWMGVLAAGLGMMSGTSASGAANIGRGALEGLQMWQGLNQQDKNNAVQQQELALKKQTADQTGAYQQSSLGIQNKDVDLRVQQLQAEIANQQQFMKNQTAQLALDTTKTQSEVATQEQARQIARYQQVYVPGDGLYVRDLMNPTAPPVRVGTGQGASGASPGGAAAPPTSPSPVQPPATTTSAPPPPGGVSASGSSAPSSSMPAAGGSPPSAARPQAGSALMPVQVPQNWQPTTTVPQGYVPPNSLNIAMSSDGGKAQADIGQKEVEGLQTSAAKATNAQAQLYQMNAAVDALPKNGLIAPGAFGNERAKLANGLNTIASTFGAQPVVDPDKVANLQEIQKGAFRLGTQMITDTNGGREAGFILQNSVANVPSLNNNYLGFKRVASGIDQANQYIIDKNNFVSDYFAKYHHTDGADALFNKMNPWQNYAQRAIDNSTMPTSRPAGVPQGSQYSMTARMWRGPDGTLYGQNGQAVQQ